MEKMSVKRKNGNFITLNRILKNRTNFSITEIRSFIILTPGVNVINIRRHVITANSAIFLFI